MRCVACGIMQPVEMLRWDTLFKKGWVCKNSQACCDRIWANCVKSINSIKLEYNRKLKKGNRRG